jgi:hypothetical protein
MPLEAHTASKQHDISFTLLHHTLTSSNLLPNPGIRVRYPHACWPLTWSFVKFTTQPEYGETQTDIVLPATYARLVRVEINRHPIYGDVRNSESRQLQTSVLPLIPMPYAQPVLRRAHRAGRVRVCHLQRRGARDLRALRGQPRRWPGGVSLPQRAQRLAPRQRRRLHLLLNRPPSPSAGRPAPRAPRLLGAAPALRRSHRPRIQGVGALRARGRRGPARRRSSGCPAPQGGREQPWKRSICGPAFHPPTHQPGARDGTGPARHGPNPAARAAIAASAQGPALCASLLPPPRRGRPGLRRGRRPPGPGPGAVRAPPPGEGPRAP